MKVKRPESPIDAGDWPEDDLGSPVSINWRAGSVALLLTIFLVLVVANLFTGSNIGLHLPHAPANGWLCYDNDPRLEPHASPDGNDHVCTEAEMRQFYDQSPAPSPLPR